MSTFEETGTHTATDLPRETRGKESFPAWFLSFVSSVRFGIILLILLGFACLLGMLIMQQNVDGFERYYAELTPAQQLVYGKLGFFDIYHAWYFNTLLAVLSTNIILASLDRFPQAWKFISRPKKNASVRWLSGQHPSHSFSLPGGKGRAGLTAEIVRACRKKGWRKTVVSRENGRTVVFAESGAWNRLGAYAVHIALLTIFFGGFMTARFGHTGQMPLRPGQTSSLLTETVFDIDRVNQVTKELPFAVHCTDIEQKLVKKDGPISAGNTIDWLTHIRIKDETGTHKGIVRMNRPFDHRGYRFFQASFVAVGRARNITVRLRSAADGKTTDVVIGRDGQKTLPDGTRIRFEQFRGNFRPGNENSDEDTSAYQNPAAVLKVTEPGGTPQTAYAFGPQMAGIPMAGIPVGGYTYQLVDFEKVADQHILSVQRDPGTNVVYAGFILLVLTLVAVFFFSHQRVWASIEKTRENEFHIVVGGNTNRNQNAFDEKIGNLVRGLVRKNREAQNS